MRPRTHRCQDPGRHPTTLPVDADRTECAASDPVAPAAAAGLEPGDVIVEVDGQRISTFADASAIIRESPGQSLIIVVERDGSPVAVAWPEPGAVAIYGPVALATDSADSQGAKDFISFVIGADGQTVLGESGAYPTLPDAPGPTIPDGAPVVSPDWAAHKLVRPRGTRK